MKRQARPALVWRRSGYHLLGQDAAGALVLSDDYLRALLTRPELAPIAESDAAERDLHARLLDDPRALLDEAVWAQLGDPDTRANYQLFAAFRAHLLDHPTIEAAYRALFDSRPIRLPPLFIDQLAHVLVQHALHNSGDPLRHRAGEVLFRSQKVSLHAGGVLLADEETVEMYAATGGLGSLGQMLVEAVAPMKRVELDVLTEDNAADYWPRADRFDTVLDIAFTRPGLDALCRVLEAWLGHLAGLAARVTPVQKIEDPRWMWHVGLDAEASALLNDLYGGKIVLPERLQRLLALFRLEIRDEARLPPALRGRPVYLGLMADPRETLRIKPQNLLVNLPLVAG